jgi:hypothetical protein
LFWFNLEEAQGSPPPVQGGILSEGYQEYAFSPDSQSLAMWACRTGAICRLEVLDFASGDTTAFYYQTNVFQAAYLAWSPDGRYLAALIQEPQYFQWALIVIDIQTETTIYQSANAPFEEWYSGNLPEDAPVKAWGIEYPPLPASIRGCALP